MICKHCGAAVPNGGAFCARCGQPVVFPRKSPSPIPLRVAFPAESQSDLPGEAYDTLGTTFVEPRQTPSTPVVSTRKRHVKVIVAVVVLLLIVAAIVVLVVLRPS